jgi:hypothetical protein
MIRVLATSTLALGLLVLGCGGSDKKPTGPTDTGGAAGSDEGSGGATAGTGGTKTGGTGGSTTPTGTGGMVSTGGTGGGETGGSGGADTGGSAGSGSDPADASTSTDAIPPGPDAMSMMGDGGSALGGEVFPGKPWIHLCPKAWNQTQCCELLCQCLDAYCTSSPLDKPRIPNCMNMCKGLSDMRARCQVYHCFESQSPTAVKDHDSHCGHASGRVGGGSCTILGMQQ